MRYLLSAIAGIALISGVFFYGRNVGRTEELAAWNAEKIKLEQQADKREDALLAAKQEADQKLYNYEQKYKTTVASTNSTIRGLRNAIAARRESDNNPATLATAIATTATYRQFFGECTERYAEMGRRADEINVTAHGLQDYVSGVVQR